MKIEAIKTPIFKLREDLAEFIIRSLGKRKLREGDVLSITSKIVSLAEGQVVPKKDWPDKALLVQQESDTYLGAGAYGCHLTIKHGLMIPSAGIDESNTEGDYFILFPEDPYDSAERLWKTLKKHYKLKKLGILITDSHTTPLRRGVTGISLAHFGFCGVTSCVGKKDIYGRPLQFTYINNADALAVTAVYQMGESNERIPLVLLRDCNLKFSGKDTRNDCRIPPEEDIYLPILIGEA